MPEHTPAPTPIRGVYGFVMYLSFKLFFIIYLVWAIVPEKYFKQISITFLPDRHWAITVPIYLLTVLTIFAFVIYPSLGLCMTPNVDDLTTIKDSFASGEKIQRDECRNSVEKTTCICLNKKKCYKDAFMKSRLTSRSKVIPDLRDLDICEVSQHLYLRKGNSYWE